jgi:G3E family GTPase
MGDLARMQIQAADIVVLNKVDLVSAGDLADVEKRVHEMAPGSRILEVIQGRVPLELIFEAESRPLEARHHQGARDRGDHEFAAWHWTSDHQLSLPKLRSALETLPDTVYRCKGIICLEELPVYRYVLQMVGKRYHLEETGRWGAELPRSEIVLIGGRDGIDGEELRRTFDACVGTGDETQSPVLRLARKLELAL